MSLVGSLEDLGLGDILQVISLSRKSGVLLLRTDLGNGRIIFRDGLIRGAFREGDSTSLRELVAGSETVPPAELDAAWEQARTDGNRSDVPSALWHRSHALEGTEAG